MSINYVSAVLFVKDVGASRRFYEGTMGQEVELDHGECIVFTAGFAVWLEEYASNLIFKGRGGHVLKKGTTGVELYFETDDIEDARSKIARGGARLAHDIEEQPWGQRVFRAYDPDGYMIEVAEPMEIVIKRYLAQGMSVEDTAKMASMPVDIVRQTAGQPRI